MTSSTSARLRGAASHLAVAALGLAGGAGLMWGIGTHARGDTGRPRAAVTTHGEWVTFGVPGSSDSVRAYVAYPERKDKAPAVIVVHEIFGLTDWEPTVVDRLAMSGYVAVVPDLLSSTYGRSPADPDSGRRLIAQLKPDRITRDLNAAFAYLNGLPAVRSGDVGVMGFCWGGTQTFRYATNNPDLKAVAICYGASPDTASLSRIRAPLLGVYAENDARIGATIPDAAARLKALGKPFSYEIYPGTGHGFLKPGREGSDGPQVERAWGNILAFFKDKLRG